ncbi:MAG: hypothetical protein OXH84_06770 [Gammaproteobacteria bacterium]|nr:hypothetical protein [Gammaproteobacteria bacterium]
MKIITTNFVIALVVIAGFAIATSVQAQDGRYRIISEDSATWFNKGFNINELRESTNSSFDLLDADSNGRISLDEIDIDFEKVTEDQVQTMRRRARVAQEKFMKWDAEIDRFDICDTNQDGVMDRDEFDNEEKNIRRHRLQLGLDELDTDRNGSVDRGEFSAHLDSLEEMDEDGDGYLSRKEYSKSDNPALLRDAFSQSFRVFGRDDGSSTNIVRFKTEDGVEVESDVKVEKRVYLNVDEVKITGKDEDSASESE